MRPVISLSTTTPLTTSIRICSVPPSRPRLVPHGGTSESRAGSPLLRSPRTPILPARTAGRRWRISWPSTSLRWTAGSKRTTRSTATSAIPTTGSTFGLFETGNPTRYYLPFADIDLGRLELSDTVSECPYKGDGQHWHLITDGEPVPDVAWSLPHPLPEGFAAAEHLCFYPNKVDLEVDGEHITD